MTQTKVGIYIRTSTELQHESIVLQEKELRGYCATHEYEIVDKYVDFGVSGSTAQRKEFKRMMIDAEQGKFALVLVTKLDRFARSVIDCVTSIRRLEENNVAFASTSQPIDTSSSMGRFVLTIMSAVAEFEREIIKERMDVGRMNAAKNGKLCHKPKKQLNKAKILGMLENKKLSASAIAKFVDVDTSTVTRRLAEWGYTFDYAQNKWIKTGNTPDDLEE